MNSSIFLTAFLIGGGALAFWCSLKNYDWFFNVPGFSQVFIHLVGRPTARLAFLLFSLVLLGWGITRVVNPPPQIPTAFIYDLASPGGIDLTQARDAETALRQAGSDIRDLQSDEVGWVSFWRRLDADVPYFHDALASSEAGPDFHEGFAFSNRSDGDKKLAGRIVYFDANLVSCDNVLFSSHPLSSASFVIIICTPRASRHNGFGDSLGVFYCRAGSAPYARMIQ